MILSHDELRLENFSTFTEDLVFSFSSRQCGTPQRSPRPPALVLEGFSSEERLEPGPGPLRCTSSSPPSRSQACPPLTSWTEGRDDDDAPSRVPDHVLGDTVFLASPTGPLPSTE